eukprot:SM014231S00565  [mRNA]  locus=s14231:38:300:- [translate_table: standard]
MGVNELNSRRAIRLPRKVTLSFLPYAAGVRGQAEVAARAGHEIMLHVPME